MSGSKNTPEGIDSRPEYTAVLDSLTSLSQAKRTKLRAIELFEASHAVRERARYILLNSLTLNELEEEVAEEEDTREQTQLDLKAQAIVEEVGSLSQEIQTVRDKVLAHIAAFKTPREAALGIMDLTYENEFENNADVTQLIGTMEYERLCRARACELAGESEYNPRWVLA